MSEQISLSRSDVARAQLVVKLNRSLGRDTEPAIRKIADAGAESSGDAHTNGQNGH